MPGCCWSTAIIGKSTGFDLTIGDFPPDLFRSMRSSARSSARSSWPRQHGHAAFRPRLTGSAEPAGLPRDAGDRGQPARPRPATARPPTSPISRLWRLRPRRSATRSRTRGSASTGSRPTTSRRSSGAVDRARPRGERRVARRVGDRPASGRPERPDHPRGRRQDRRRSAAAVRATAAGGVPLAWLAIESADEAAASPDGSAGGPRRRGRPPLDVLFRLNPDVAPETQSRGSPSARAARSSG